MLSMMRRFFLLDFPDFAVQLARVEQFATNELAESADEVGPQGDLELLGGHPAFDLAEDETLELLGVHGGDLEYASLRGPALTGHCS